MMAEPGQLPAAMSNAHALARANWSQPPDHGGAAVRLASMKRGETMKRGEIKAAVLANLRRDAKPVVAERRARTVTLFS